MDIQRATNSINYKCTWIRKENYMDNLKIRMLREKLINDLNEVDLPIECKRLVLKEIMSLVNDAADGQIEKEREMLIESQSAEEAKQDAESVQQNELGELAE